jgi:L-lactate dehydrogenase complex protein LldE
MGWSKLKCGSHKYFSRGCFAAARLSPIRMGWLLTWLPLNGHKEGMIPRFRVVVPMQQTKPRVALFVTCLVDLHRPSVGFAAIALLEQAGCQVEVPRAQTCCGQPAYNSGDRASARELAVSILDAFGGYDYVVVPSGSCGGMLSQHMPHLFDDDPNLRARADALAAKTYELVSFLTDIRGLDCVVATTTGTLTYHDSCAGLRELGIKQQPRKLLEAMGATIKEMAEPEICCGFGGTFCVKYPAISVHMVSNKTADIVATGAETVLAGDLGCLLNIAGRLQREGHPTKVRHIAEVLAGMTDDLPAIGEPKV